MLHTLLHEQSVTRAARKLHRTPSAISHSLNRLRDLFGDEQLVRDGQAMRPTARAMALSESVPKALNEVVCALASPDLFDASTSTRTFRLAVPEFGAERPRCGRARVRGRKKIVHALYASRHQRGT